MTSRVQCRLFSMLQWLRVASSRVGLAGEAADVVAGLDTGPASAVFTVGRDLHYGVESGPLLPSTLEIVPRQVGSVMTQH